jgi:hypothetical protein
MTVTPEMVQEMLDDDPSLNTLKNQFTLQQIWDLIEDKALIGDDEELYNALIDVMYATRPKGVT